MAPAIILNKIRLDLKLILWYIIHVMRTIASETELLGLKPFKTVSLRRELSYQKHEFPCVVPVGTYVTLYFSEKVPSRVYFDFGGHLRATRVVNASKTFSGGFTKEPSSKSMQKWEWEGGFCKTVTGHKTEPDGFGPDGSPSWMLALGLI